MGILDGTLRAADVAFDGAVQNCHR